jgi:hypothetical protein
VVFFYLPVAGLQCSLLEPAAPAIRAAGCALRRLFVQRKAGSN